MTATDISVPETKERVPHAPGIYFNMPDDRYHADPSLGSGDHKRLLWNPSTYWHQSWMNPARKVRKTTPGQLRGQAMHKLLYEGQTVFDRLYMCGARHDPEATAAEKGAATKATNAMAARLCKTALPADDYDQIIIATAMITKNPKLKDVFTNGFGEVSIFWVDANGVPCKARIDYLKIRGVGDAKGVGNEYDKHFPQACREAIARYRYDIQVAHYLEARALIGKFVADGCVHGDHDAELLKRVAASKTFAWQWIFYQTEGAPITWSKSVSPGNPLHEFARGQMLRARQNYLDYLQRFGRSMWLLIEDPSELMLEEMPGWYGRESVT